MPEDKELTGYPSIDKPWLKYYSETAIHAKMPECSAYDYIVDINQKRLDKPALNYFGKRTTYREMIRQIDRCASALKACGVKRGEIISVSLPNTPEAVYLFYAISKLGAIANMIDPRSSSDGIAAYINETNSTRLFAVDLIAGKIKEIETKTHLEQIITVSPGNSLPAHLRALLSIKNRLSGFKNTYTEWNEFMHNASHCTADAPKLEGLSNEAVMIVHTGGTTGSPKGVLISNRNINAIPFQSLQFPTDLQSKHIWLDIMPPFIAYGIGSGLHFPLAIGQEVVLIPAFKPEELDKLILKYKPNHITGVPSHWHYLINSKRLANKDLSFLITCCVGGDTTSSNLEIAANEFLSAHHCSYKIAKGYGMTEVNGSIGRTTNDNNPIGSVGIPFAHSIVKVCDPETGKELEYNEVGEIYLSGPSVMLGYYNNLEETKRIKIQDENGDCWIKSGDLGYMTEDGNIFINDRIKRMIVRHDGFKVFPSMIENAVSSHAAVEQCCAIGIADNAHNQGKVPSVYVMLTSAFRGRERQIEQELVALCQKELPEYAQPVEWHFRENLPLTSIGKIDYRALEEKAREN